jgi:hypothetical protein
VIRRLTGQLTYANVMATTAVFIALGGGAYAAIKLPANSVGTKQIKKNGVRGADLASGAVTAAVLGNGAVTFSKLAPNAVDGSKVVDNSLGGGDVNEAALGLVPLAAQSDSLSRVDYETATGTAPPSSASTAVTAVCPAGFVAVGGGGKVSDPNNAGLNDSYPEGRTGWTARAYNSGTAAAVTVTSYVVCVPAAATTP